jgi:hypothetical protein
MISLVIPHLRTLPLLALKRSELLSIPPTTRSFIVTSRSNTVLASLLAAVATVVGPGHLSFQQAPFALRPARSPVIDPCGQSRCTIDLFVWRMIQTPLSSLIIWRSAQLSDSSSQEARRNVQATNKLPSRTRTRTAQGRGQTAAGGHTACLLVGNMLGGSSKPV